MRQFEREITLPGSVTFYLPQCVPQTLLLENIEDSRWPNPVCPPDSVPLSPFVPQISKRRNNSALILIMEKPCARWPSSSVCLISGWNKRIIESTQTYCEMPENPMILRQNQ